MSEAVLYQLDGETATLTLNRPEQLNALGEELVDGLQAGLDRAEIDNARYIVFRAEGKGFSGGLDLSNLDKQNDADVLLQLLHIERLLQRIRHSPRATIALVHGACYGAAADLVLCCRTRICTADARFLMPGLRFGIVLGTQRLRDVVGEPAANFLLNRGKPFTATEARETAFITDTIEPDHWPDAISKTIKNLSGFTSSAYAHRVSSLTPDTRAQDMNALVTSIIDTSSDGSIKDRLKTYIAEVKAARKTHSETSG